MAYSEKIARRIREALVHLQNVTEKKMFGGLAFLVDNKMCINAGADKIMCRINPAETEKAIKKKGCQIVIMRGREYKGYVYIDEKEFQHKKDFDYWIRLALDYNKIANSSKNK